MGDGARAGAGAEEADADDDADTNEDEEKEEAAGLAAVLSEVCTPDCCCCVCLTTLNDPCPRLSVRKGAATALSSMSTSTSVSSLLVFFVLSPAPAAPVDTFPVNTAAAPAAVVAVAEVVA